MDNVQKHNSCMCCQVSATVNVQIMVLWALAQCRNVGEYLLFLTDTTSAYSIFSLYLRSIEPPWKPSIRLSSLFLISPAACFHINFFNQNPV
jgi:hypothetical protein